MPFETLMNTLSPLCDHASFVRDTLAALAQIVPNDMLSYNEIPERWRVDPTETEGSEAGLVVWTPAAPCTGLGLDDQRELALRYLHEHPGRHRGGALVTRNSDLCPPARWHRTTLYNELHRPLHIETQCLLYLPAPPGFELVISYSREHQDFSDRELALLARVQRSLSRVTRDHWRYLDLCTERALWRGLTEREDRGIIHLDAEARARWASPRARSLLREHGLGLEGQGLPVPLSRWLAPLRAGLHQTLPPFRRHGRDHTLEIEFYPSEGPRQGGSLVAQVHPLPRSERALDLHEHSPQLAAALGLTPRQAEVALWMSCGKTNGDIAEILTIRPATVKKHLEHIFDSLGVENRTSAANVVHDAIGLAARAAPPEDGKSMERSPGPLG